MKSITKRTLAIIASGVLPALALAAPGGGGAAIGPVNEGPQTSTTNAAQKTAVQQGMNQTGSIPPNAQSGMTSGSNTKQSTNVSAKTKTTTKNTSTNTGGKR